jgi:hypothetical protein
MPTNKTLILLIINCGMQLNHFINYLNNNLNNTYFESLKQFQNVNVEMEFILKFIE